MGSMREIFNSIKQSNCGLGHISIEIKENTCLDIPINKFDYLAVKAIEFLLETDEDLTFENVSEICDDIKFILTFCQVLDAGK
jgi:hypothetical protein